MTGEPQGWLHFLPALTEAIRSAQHDYEAYNKAHFVARPGEFFALELAGEAGELANKEKKRWKGSDISTDDLAEEVADVVIAALNYSNARGIDLGAAVAEKMLEIEARRHKADRDTCEDAE